MKKILMLLLMTFAVSSLIACTDRKLDNDFYIVTFFTFTSDPNTIASQRVEAGELASEPAAPFNPSSTFIQWIDIKNNPFDWNTPINESIVLFAQWATRTFTISFDLNGGNFGSSVEIPTSFETGEVINFPRPEREGYEFVNWLLVNDGVVSNIIISGTRNHNTDLNVIANWRVRNWNVQFTTNQENVHVPAMQFSFGSIISTLPVLEDTATQIFDGWYIRGTSTKVQNGDHVIWTGTGRLDARWIAR